MWVSDDVKAITVLQDKEGIKVKRLDKNQVLLTVESEICFAKAMQELIMSQIQVYRVFFERIELEDMYKHMSEGKVLSATESKNRYERMEK